MQSPDWFDGLYEHLGKAAYDLALRRVGDDELAQDVTAEAFIFTYKQQHQLTDEKTAEDFLLQTVERYSARAKTDKKKRERNQKITP